MYDCVLLMKCFNTSLECDNAIHCVPVFDIL